MHYDILIRNGRVFDGFGNSLNADIAILDGQVAMIAPSIPGNATQIIDATGLWVTPGFIDIHTHYDLEVAIAPQLQESTRHGVTSIVMGGCSLSTLYAKPEDIAQIFSRVETFPEELIKGWLANANTHTSAPEYFSYLSQLKLGPNVASMLGHSAIRVAVMGLERSLHQKASRAEIETMRRLAEQALEAGCIGISVDMVHWHKVDGIFAGRALPSHHAGFLEYKMLADVCRKRDSVFQATPNPENFLSFLMIFYLCLSLGKAPLRCTILSALDMDLAPNIWRLFPILLFILNRMLGCNIRFQTLPEPFTIYADGHITPLFEEFSAGVKLNNCKTAAERKALWQNEAFQKEFISSWQKKGIRTFHRDLSKITVIDCPDKDVIGYTITQAAKRANIEPLRYLMHLLETYDESLRWVACSANQRPKIREHLMKHPHILPGFSDAGAHGRNLAFFDSALSLLRQAVQTGFISPEQAIYRITREPARWFNLDTGYLKAGTKADLVILDPKLLESPIPEAVLINDPTLNQASRMVKRDANSPVQQVWINGQLIYANGQFMELSDVATGKILKQCHPTTSSKDSLKRFRNRISQDCSLPEETPYWQAFLRKHQHPGNITLHCIAVLLTYIIPAFAWLFHNPLILLFFPISHLIGLLGHACFERTPIDQQDLFFSWRASASLHKMLFYVLTGRYGNALSKAKTLEPILC